MTSEKKRWVGARKAQKQLGIARMHFDKAISIIDEYNLRNKEIDNADCVYSLAKIESALGCIEDEQP